MLCLDRLTQDLKPIMSKFLETSEGTSATIDKSPAHPQYATSFLTQVKAFDHLHTDSNKKKTDKYRMLYARTV